MQDHKVRRILVIDERGACCGIVAQADLIRAAGDEGERVVEAVSQPGEEARPTL